jgi:DMSO/TMAO reductase YedYZ molybdopterin-dependent catalytic subunit
MKRLLPGVLLILVLVSCSPVAAGESLESPAALAQPSPPQATAPPVEEPRDVPFGIEEMHPAEVDNSTLPITPVEGLHRTGQPQEYDIETYRLVVDGLVDNPLSLSYEDLLHRAEVTETVLLICPGFFWDNATWTGTPLSLILEEAGVSPDATRVRFVAGDGYEQTLSLEQALADGVFLAYEVDGETLPVEHGYPLRLVARYQYGSKWVKWLERIEVEE